MASLAATVALGLAAGAPAVADKSAPVAVDYVSLGDSYPAGVGVGTNTEGCGTNDGAYPSLWAATKPGSVKLTQAACSGATLSDVNGKQLVGLNADTDLVSLTAGANDLEVMDALLHCLSPATAAQCETDKAKIAQALKTTVPANLRTVLTSVKAKAPKAKVAIVGYADPFTETEKCQPSAVPLEAQKLANSVVDGLNVVLRGAAQQAGATFIDVAGAFAKHGVCSAEPWIIGVGLPDTLLHPNKLGQQAYLKALTAEVGTVDQVIEWIVKRDAPKPSASASAAPVAAGGSGGGVGASLAYTGTNVTVIVGAGLGLAAVGVILFIVSRRRRLQVTVD